MRILVTGSNGQLGRCIRDVAKASVDEYIFTDADELDITDSEAVELCLKVNRFDIIVNCAAYTNVEQAEQQEDIALRINGHALAILPRRHAVMKCFLFTFRLIMFSTDMVTSPLESRTSLRRSMPMGEPNSSEKKRSNNQVAMLLFSARRGCTPSMAVIL